MNELTKDILQKLGFGSLHKIQTEILEKGLGKKQVVLYSPTGTGKTLGYLLFILHHLKKEEKNVQALVIVPSRELALQIEEVFRKMDTGYKVNSCYGGHPIKTEINNFREPPSVVIGTPGRIADHLRRESFNKDFVELVVLDEFDKCLEMGFNEEMQFILGSLTQVSKRILTSATKNLEFPVYTEINKPFILDFLDEDLQPKITIKALRAKENDKFQLLLQLIFFIGNQPTLIFCNHREGVERISMLLKDCGIAHDTFHGGLEQEQRERALIKFRNGSLHFLLSTDLGSRGLDIPEIRNIIHYQRASKKIDFIHRNGRTARMGADGTAWLLLSETEPFPDYLEEVPEISYLPENLPRPAAPEWITFFVGGGKKEKIGKKDILGFLIQQGGLEISDIGLLSVMDYSSFAAVKREKAHQTLSLLKGEKLKGKRIKIAISQ